MRAFMATMEVPQKKKGETRMSAFVSSLSPAGAPVAASCAAPSWPACAQQMCCRAICTDCSTELGSVSIEHS